MLGWLAQPGAATLVLRDALATSVWEAGDEVVVSITAFHRCQSVGQNAAACRRMCCHRNQRRRFDAAAGLCTVASSSIMSSTIVPSTAASPTDGSSEAVLSAGRRLSFLSSLFYIHDLMILLTRVAIVFYIHEL